MAETIQAPTCEQVISSLEGQFPGKIKIVNSEVRRVYATVEKDAIYDVCLFARDNLTFEHCSSVLGVDRETTLQVVYHLSNYFSAVTIELTVDVPVDDPHIESVTPLWGGANWHERETYELFGIIFDNHPKLERLLTPTEYEFFPFRKSYKLRRQE